MTQRLQYNCIALFYLMANTATMHLPYRDSKLTRLLQPSLGGNAQIAIICTITPAVANLEETKNTLKFASRAKRIKSSAQVSVLNL
jgi:centromeric protein E